jgi:hypothetical protein
MPVVLAQDQVIDYLKRFLTHNKARGMVAEMALERELGIKNSPSQQKLLAGGWILSPKVENFHQYRYQVSVMPNLYTTANELHQSVTLLENDRGWQALATFLSTSGIGIIVSGAWSDQSTHSLDHLIWQHHIYHDERLIATNGDKPFALWSGTRGRASKGSEWQEDVIQRFEAVLPEQLMSLGMRQAFFYGYLKQQLNKPLEDPYDVDAFIVSFAGRVMPVEIKEKSPTRQGDFGLDAGRILMMLRLCLATDSNALYLIREVDNSPARQLVRWRYITLADMVIGSHWNLQAGGAGMLGGSTQTIMMAGSMFGEFTLSKLSENWLAENASLQGSVRTAATNLAQNLSKYLG